MMLGTRADIAAAKHDDLPLPFAVLDLNGQEWPGLRPDNVVKRMFVLPFGDDGQVLHAILDTAAIDLTRRRSLRGTRHRRDRVRSDG